MGSEFGKGLSYCLGLFLCHVGEIRKDLEVFKDNENKAYEMWFYKATDHLFEFQWEQAPTKSLQRRCKKFQNECLSLRRPINDERVATPSDFYVLVDEAKEILRAIDRFNGVKTQKGEWE